MRERLRASLGALVAQLFFIAAGVYLGNRADDWRQGREHRRAARASLENFRTEFRANRALVARRLPYHRGLLDSLGAARRRVRATGEAPRTLDALLDAVGFQGTQSVTFRRTAWDLSLATQALSYVAPRLAFDVADVYQDQAAFQRYQDTFLSNMLTPASFNDAHTVPVGVTLGAFMWDVVSTEQRLVAAYDRLLPRLDSAIARLPK